MIPASYFFRSAYRDQFEEIAPPEGEVAPPRGQTALDRLSAAILGFTYGAAHLPLGGNALAPHGRRR